jgi:hypothetical protein
MSDTRNDMKMFGWRKTYTAFVCIMCVEGGCGDCDLPSTPVAATEPRTTGRHACTISGEAS